MIIINKSGHLTYKNLKFKCAIGKAGIGEKKIEGDNITPKGTYQVIKIYYRKDRVKELVSQIKLIKIEKNIRRWKWRVVIIDKSITNFDIESQIGFLIFFGDVFTF